MLECNGKTGEITHSTYHSDHFQHSQPQGLVPLHSLGSGRKADKRSHPQQYISALNKADFLPTHHKDLQVGLSRQAGSHKVQHLCVFTDEDT